MSKTRKFITLTAMGVSLFGGAILPLGSHAHEIDLPKDFASVNYDDVNSLQGALDNKDFPFLSEVDIAGSQYNSFAKQQKAYKKTRSYFMERIVALGGEAEVSPANRSLLWATKASSNYGYFKDIQPIAPDVWIALFNRPSDGIQYTENIMREHKVNNQHAFCIDPGAPIMGTPNYVSADLASVVGKGQAEHISAIQTVVNGNWNDTTSIAGQEMIWGIRGATNIVTEPMRQAAVGQAKETIQSGVNDLLAPVKLDKTFQTLDAGKSATFTVQSGGKDLYVANVSKGATAKLEGSKIVVTTENNAPEEVIVTLGKGKKEANQFVWSAGSNQRLSTAEYNQANAAQVKMTLTKKGKIVVHKKDEADKPLTGAEFTQYDKAGNVVAVKTTDKTGDVSFDIASNNTYEVKETKNPAGYHGTFDQKNITLVNNGQIFEYTAKNTQDKGKIIIHKKDETGKAVVDAEFTQINKAGKTVAVKNTDKAGNVTFDIQSNETYGVKETKVPEGYEGSFEKKNITLKENGQKFEYTAINNHKHEEIIQTDSTNYQNKGLWGLLVAGVASVIGCIGIAINKYKKI